MASQQQPGRTRGGGSRTHVAQGGGEAWEGGANLVPALRHQVTDDLHLRDPMWRVGVNGVQLRPQVLATNVRRLPISFTILQYSTECRRENVQRPLLRI